MSLAPRFHRLAVNDLRREAPDAVSLTFAIPKELSGDYSFMPGQYLTLRTTMDGEEVRRSYSICSGPDDGELRIAVKKVDGGAFSSWAADELKAGDQLDVMTPTGRFGVTHAPEEAPRAPASRRSCRSSRACWRGSRTAASSCSMATARRQACCSWRLWKN
jgi:ring-1,2-phenylacetyl-CoA epoxidase subunit PaaE